MFSSLHDNRKGQHMSRSGLDSGILSFDSGIDLLGNVEFPVIEQKSVVETRIRATGSLVTLFSLGLLFVAGCSVYDAYLVYHYREVIDEQNEFCRWLIELEPESVSIFLCAKLLGTATVIGSVMVLAKYWRRAAHASLASLVVFQIGLMGYLHYYDSVDPDALRSGASVAESSQLPVGQGWDDDREAGMAVAIESPVADKKSKRTKSKTARSGRLQEGQSSGRARVRKSRQLKRIENQLRNLGSHSR